jgi:catechol 2,3-dioxygenase-like lactoylglutathione lyase family enzyme
MARVTGVNHIAIVVNDMKEGLRLYRDILGLPVVSRTSVSKQSPEQQAETNVQQLKNNPNRLYNLDMGSGITLTLVELPDALIVGQSSFAYELWPGDYPLTPLGGTDHVSMNVDSEADLIEIRERLIAGGFDVSDIERIGPPLWWKQLRFHDVAGNALEISTWDYDDPAWDERRARIERESLFDTDPDPV